MERAPIFNRLFVKAILDGGRRYLAGHFESYLILIENILESWIYSCRRDLISVSMDIAVILLVVGVSFAAFDWSSRSFKEFVEDELEAVWKSIIISLLHSGLKKDFISVKFVSTI